MTASEIREHFASLSYAYEQDIRKQPDDYRHRTFRTGWSRVVDGRVYAERSLRRLTWANVLVLSLMNKLTKHFKCWPTILDGSPEAGHKQTL